MPNVHIMVTVGMLGVLVGDGLMFTAGRVFGHRILEARFVARVMTPKRYAQVQEKFDKYGTACCFVARFLPGLRTPIFITAGISRKVSYLCFLMHGWPGGVDFRAGVGVFGRLWRGKH